MSVHTNPADPKPPSVDRLSLLWRRVNDHKMVQWSVAYIALAYGVQHGVELTTNAFEWPHAVVRVSMLLLVLGLPLVMTLAWYHGERASRRISGPELTIISLLLVGISVLFYAFARPSEEVAAGPKPAQASVARAPGGISIAVLPFANLSGDTGQEFFSDGMTEEITSALAKVPNLRMVGRTSAFQFKGQNKDLRGIGQSLGATYLIEGSVRKAGSRVRVTAQLVKANDGIGLWTDNYDRDLRDIFATQEDIAQAIAGALRVPLGLVQGEHLVSDRINDLESYDQYLRAKALTRAAAAIPDEVIATLEQLVAREPNYAPAWALLSRAYREVSLGPISRTGTVEEARRARQSRLDKVATAAQKAIQLDSRQASAYAALADIQNARGNWATAEDLYKQALALDPNDPNILYNLSLLFSDVGRQKEALSIRDRVRTLEPLSSLYNIGFASSLRNNGQNQASISLLEAVAPSFLRDAYLADGYAIEGRYIEAANTLLAIKGDVANRRSVEDAARLIRTAPAATGPPNALPQLEGELNFVYAFVGATNRVMEWPERALQMGFPSDNTTKMLWRPRYSALRKTQRFKTFVRKAGLVDYWRARGWPDLCHPTTGDDFECN